MTFRRWRWCGPYPGCPVKELHKMVKCKTCHAARMRAYRRAGLWRWKRKAVGLALTVFI